jgi:hypothetical protein
MQLLAVHCSAAVAAQLLLSLLLLAQLRLIS